MEHRYPTVTTFPSESDLLDLRQRFAKGGIVNLSDPERWHWHGYTYGMRRVLMADFGRVSPVDPLGEWYSDSIASAAETFYRIKFGRQVRKKFVPASNLDAVRENWQEIPGNELTHAEMKLAEPHIRQMAGRARESLRAMTAKWDRAFGKRKPRDGQWKFTGETSDAPPPA
jgi:hypothetical protein